MVRSAEDDAEVLRTADAMESAGAVVVAITPDGEATHQGALAPHQRYQVWARVASHETCNAVDVAIERSLEELDRTWAQRALTPARKHR